MTSEDQRIEHGFSAARFFRHAGVVRKGLVPGANAFGDVCEEFGFFGRRRGEAELCAESGAREGVGHCGVAGDAKSAVIGGGFGPRGPIFFAAVEVGGRGSRVPVGACSLGDENAGEGDHGENHHGAEQGHAFCEAAHL